MSQEQDTKQTIELPLYTTASVIDFLQKMDSESLRWTLQGAERDIEVMAEDGVTVAGRAKSLVSLSLQVAPGYSSRVYLQKEEGVSLEASIPQEIVVEEVAPDVACDAACDESIAACSVEDAV